MHCLLVCVCVCVCVCVQNAEYLDKMDKYMDTIYETESSNKALTRMVDQYRDKNVELEREKFEAISSEFCS